MRQLGGGEEEYQCARRCERSALSPLAPSRSSGPGHRGSSGDDDDDDDDGDGDGADRQVGGGGIRLVTWARSAVKGAGRLDAILGGGSTPGPIAAGSRQREGKKQAIQQAS